MFIFHFTEYWAMKICWQLEVYFYAVLYSVLDTEGKIQIPAAASQERQIPVQVRYEGVWATQPTWTPLKRDKSLVLTA
jgi:hypothetical protein